MRAPTGVMDGGVTLANPSPQRVVKHYYPETTRELRVTDVLQFMALPLGFVATACSLNALVEIRRGIEDKGATAFALFQ